jgi:hypothetical protein
MTVCMSMQVLAGVLGTAFVYSYNTATEFALPNQNFNASTLGANLYIKS